MIKKLIIPVLLMFGILVPAMATHNRAGEITYRQISGFTYEFTVTTFTYTYSIVETSQSYSDITGKTSYGRQVLYIDWGDNSSSTDDPNSYAYRKSRDTVPENKTYIKSTFTAKHTFPGEGVYEVVMEDPNRNYGVRNIPNSVGVVFSVKTTLLVKSSLGINNTPVLLNYPIDKAAVGKRFIHNPAAYDPDGDSLSYSLGICTREKGIPIESYTLPRATDSIYVNPYTGDLVWDTPIDTGIFNIAINIEEWRYGIRIGKIVRDMQIEVYNTSNSPPVIQPIPNVCIEAGKKLSIPVFATDADNNKINLSASGEIFNIGGNSVSFNSISNTPGFAASLFEWQTNCNFVRKQPYYVVVKASDISNGIKLVTFTSFSVKVIAPPPVLTKIVSSVSDIKLTWTNTTCPNAIGYEIYRSTGSTGFVPDTCITGLPDGIGFEKIATINNIDSVTYTDNNNGKGLDRGIYYCYRIVAFFKDQAQSYPSNELCSSLLPGVPILTSASVTNIDENAGTILVNWAKPLGLDTINPGPYKYKIYRSNNLNKNSFGNVPIDSVLTSSLSDTTFTDINLNTVTFPYNYKVELYSTQTGTDELLGAYETASTAYPVFEPNDNRLTIRFEKNVPWFNYRYIVYRLNTLTSQFDSIGFTDTDAYIDSNLVNNQPYTYKALCLGNRAGYNNIYKTYNWTHKNTGIPVDLTPPCPPVLNLISNCDSSVNKLIWTNPNHSCADDVVKYNIYYKGSLQADYTLINSITDSNDTTFTHAPTGSISGCYIVTALDTVGNESAKTNVKCFEGCAGYDLPNVFTPNFDNKLDIYVSINPKHYINQVNMRIYNRWGKLVFETTDADINWDGRDMNTKKIVSPGVYFYLCDVYEPRLSGIRLYNLKGFIHVFTGENKTNYSE